MNIDWSQSGYPPLHYIRLRQSRHRALVITLFIAVLSAVVVVSTIFDYFPSMIAAAIGAAMTIYALVGNLIALYAMHKYVQVIPYFQRPLADVDTFLAGHSIARFLCQLDAIADQLHVRGISSYGFNDDLLGQQLIWHDPADGLATITALTAQLANETLPNELKSNLERDLYLWRIALEKAASTKVRFCVLLLHGNSTSGHEWDIRTGSAF